MSKPYLIAPSILSADFAHLSDEIRAAEDAGADWIHVDVMDGHFVPNLTMGPFIVATLRRITALPIDVHLMIEDPDRSLPAYADSGANRMTVHVEACRHLHRTLQNIRELGCASGVALNPGTPGPVIEPVLDLVDLVLVMTVNPGFSGQVYLKEMEPKIRLIRDSLANRREQIYLQVDGGINAETVSRASAAGADVYVAATAVFKHPAGIKAGIEALRAGLE